jgi:hypothetical protein
MKTSKKGTTPENDNRNEKTPQLITEMSSKNGVLTIQMDLTKPTRKTFHGNDMFKTRETAAFGKNEELMVEIFAIKRPVPDRRFHI